ncbi:unnamed protein product [Candidula unifasciata]|uniref:MICOS complex subunit n=1 Tax=Candidula unifasciata TaxID=100452 RepID=A0A8S4A510_9EUPU|nr:unnamed protein product [Candidula unifasciata]
MATLTRRVLRLVAVVGTIPAVGVAVGYRIRSLQAAERTGERRIYRVCDLPLYPSPDTDVQQVEQKNTYPRNVVEEQIGVVRKEVQGFLGQFANTFETVRVTTETGIEHSKATLDYIQNNPGELPRVVFIAVAGMGGIVLGYRGGILRKLTYGSIAAVSCASVCYPKKTVELGQTSLDYVKELWKENVGEDLLDKYWPFHKGEHWEKEDRERNEKLEIFLETIIIFLQTISQSSSSADKTEGQGKQSGLKGDPGQSNPADKDLYSTRSS